MTQRCLAILVGLAALTPAQASDELFRSRVAPLLSRACLSCHDAQKKRGGLDLSSAKSARLGGDDGVVIVPGDGGKSKLVQFVSGAKPRMPRSGPKLTEGEVALLKRWIDEGAKWPADLVLKATGGSEEETWWSLRSLKRPPVPGVKDKAWGRTAVDAFILAALEAKGLKPSAEADRRTLIRRVTFDLTGLPPTPDEVEAFVGDTSADAYERVVDTLLSSPAYGERWGRHWLDVARYGDTHGYDKDKRRDHAWRYRDWVIRAFNDDLPYRDFIRQQLAGDVLRPGDPNGVIAAGFVVAGPWDFVGHVELREGTVDKEKTRVLDRDDMVTSAAGTFMSLTVGCARCHDHKFDPIAQRDYYRLQAVFAGVERGDRRIENAEAVKQREALTRRKETLAEQQAEVQQKIAVAAPKLKRFEDVLIQLRKEMAALPSLPKAKPSPSNGYHSQILPSADHTRWVQVDLGASMDIEEVRLFPARPTDFRDAPGFGFPVRFRIEASDEAKFEKATKLVYRTIGDFSNPGDLPFVVGETKVKARYVRVTATKLWKRLDDYVFALSEMQVISGGKNVALNKSVTAFDSIEAGRWSRKYLVDDHTSRERLPDISDPEKAKAFAQRMGLANRLRIGESGLADRIEGEIPAPLRNERAGIEKQMRDNDAALKRHTTDGPRVYSVVPIAPRSIWVLRRGDVEQKKDAVTPGGLACVTGPTFTLEKPDDEGQRRLALAEWIASEQNPLTWRSIVNRIWHYHFGRGLVDTPNDFGKMGSLPTHPELLDWLADEFRTHGSFRKLHRLLVTSSAYRQASTHDESAGKIDSDNRFLWRMNRRRLDAEGVRDAVLAVSGRLDRRMGGTGYDLFRFKDDHSPVYDHTDLARIHDPATYRRTVYRFTVRSVPNPFLDCLDSADPNQPTPVRNTTLTALQALALLNNPFMVRQASSFAERLKTRSSDIDRQIDDAYPLAFGRPATADERAAVVAYAREHGLASACRVLFNANEFLFID